MWSFVYPLNSSYKYVKKVKLNPNSNPNIFSEIIELQENGGSGGIQAQIPNCTVYIEIAVVSSVKVVLCISRPLPNKTKLKFD